MRTLRRAATFILILFLLCVANETVYSKGNPSKQELEGELYKQRRLLYDALSIKTGLDWSLLAAIDQYERTLSRAHPQSRPVNKKALTGIYIPPEVWSGRLNPNDNDTAPVSIQFFRGIGRDGSGDGIASREKDEDLLYSIAAQALRLGRGEDNFHIGLWEYYHNTRAVQRITQFAKLYHYYNRLDLNEHAFPLPLKSIYSYRSTWGYSRSWGGYRIHEGTDIFAGSGVPVRSTSYGIIEIKGWNRYGGWRIGIRDINNLYHYYAHLSGYNKSLKAGDLVRPGQIIGWVGSSGYGRPGTQGRFPPHLHYGVYRDRGLVEWAFDPYPLLRQWEHEERRAIRAQRK